MGLRESAEELCQQALAESRAAIKAQATGNLVESQTAGQVRDLDVARLRVLLGRIWSDRGLYEDGLKEVEAALPILEQQLPAQHRELALARITRISTLMARNQDDAVMAAALTELSRAGTDRVAQAVLWHEQAEWHRRYRRFDESEAAFVNLINFLKQQLPARHPLIGEVLGDYAGLVKQRGDFVLAEKLARESLDLNEQTLGEHPRMWEPLRNFGVFLRDRGDFDEAERRFTQAKQILDTRFDPAIMRTVDIQRDVLNERAHLSLNRRQVRQAVTEFRRTLELQQLVLSQTQVADHVRSMRDLQRDLGIAETLVGDFDQAEQHLRESLRIAEATEHEYDRLLRRLSYWDLLRSRGDIVSAGNYGSEIRREWDRLRATVNSDFEASLPLSLVGDRLLENEQQIPLRSSSINVDRHPWGFELSMLAAFSRPAINSPNGTKEVAKITVGLWRSAIAGRLRKAVDDHPEVLIIELHLAAALARSGETAASQTALELLLPRLRLKLGPTHPWTLLAHLSQAFLSPSKYSIPAAIKALESRFGDGHPWILLIKKYVPLQLAPNAQAEGTPSFEM
jgi:tetratricopeptide (TPR) repeat protein